MLYSVCRDLKNYFEDEKVFGTFKIENGQLNFPLLDNQYFRIVGSKFNDGIFKAPTTDLTDEEFEGAVWTLSFPREFLDLVNEIQAWQSKYGDVDMMSPYQSESFGGYSYTKNTASSSWKSTFAKRLNVWRKI